MSPRPEGTSGTSAMMMTKVSRSASLAAACADDSYAP